MTILENLISIMGFPANPQERSRWDRVYLGMLLLSFFYILWTRIGISPMYYCALPSMRSLIWLTNPYLLVLVALISGGAWHQWRTASPKRYDENATKASTRYPSPFWVQTRTLWWVLSILIMIISTPTNPAIIRCLFP